MKKNFGEIYLVQSPLKSGPDSSGTLYLVFFFKVELVPVGMTHIL